MRYLAEVSRDFAESLAEDPTAADLRVRSTSTGTGPFAGTTGKIKNVYLARSDRGMRTTDFSKVPPQCGQATAMFVGATRYRGRTPSSSLTFRGSGWCAR